MRNSYVTNFLISFLGILAVNIPISFASTIECRQMPGNGGMCGYWLYRSGSNSSLVHYVSIASGDQTGNMFTINNSEDLHHSIIYISSPNSHFEDERFYDIKFRVDNGEIQSFQGFGQRTSKGSRAMLDPTRHLASFFNSLSYGREIVISARDTANGIEYFSRLPLQGFKEVVRKSNFVFTDMTHMD